MRCLHSTCKSILIYSIVIVLLFNTYVTNVKIATVGFVGIVKDITVYALEDESDFKNGDMYVLKSLKLNISWIPPNGRKQPSSYRWASITTSLISII